VRKQTYLQDLSTLHIYCI